MEWIRLRNPGSFDVVKAVNLIGASVKESDNPIGLYGSGIKYALAQALRQNITIKICSDNKTFTLVKTTENFRGKDFDVVSFRSNTGKVIKTAITSEFGKEDWTEKWFIAREFISNCMDENGTIDIVSGCNTSDGYVDVFLPYNDFKFVMDNFNQYFDKREYGVYPGSGRVFKNGVYVGKLTGINLDLYSNYVKITESRTIDEQNAKYELESCIESSPNVEVWRSVLESENRDSLRLTYILKECKDAIHEALTLKYGKYAICPALPNIMANCSSEGFHPICFPNWTLPDGLTNYLSMCKDIGTRALNSLEQEIINKVLPRLSFFTNNEPLNIRVIEDENLVRLGDANLKTKEIRLKPSTIMGKELLHTLIHEIGHIKSGFGDYDRGFTDYFVNKLCELV